MLIHYSALSQLHKLQEARLWANKLFNLCKLLCKMGTNRKSPAACKLNETMYVQCWEPHARHWEAFNRAPWLHFQLRLFPGWCTHLTAIVFSPYFMRGLVTSALWWWKLSPLSAGPLRFQFQLWNVLVGGQATSTFKAAESSVKNVGDKGT